MSSVISSDSQFSKAQKDILLILVDLMIPAGDGMPSAADAVIFPSILNDLATEHATTVTLLDLVESIANDNSSSGFGQLGDEERLSLITGMQTSEPELLQFFQFHTVNNYYQDDRVMNVLGMEARPPHPGGYTLEPTDWSLLDPVRKRKEIYRKT